jgi:hypothetical protein
MRCAARRTGVFISELCNPSAEGAIRTIEGSGDAPDPERPDLVADEG